jgi:CHAD domain-containing protein
MGAAHDLAEVLAARHAALRAQIGAARRGTVVGVHQARVATRRLRESVPVAAVNLHGVRRRRLQRALRDMTRALGAVRECDVTSDLLQKLVASLPATPAGLARRWMRDLRSRRRDARVTVAKACDAGRVAWVDLHLEGLIAARAATDDAGWRVRLAHQLDIRARRLRARIERAGLLFVVEPLHDVRIAAKRLRYALELAGDCRLAPVARPLAQLKRMQDVLGRLHDLDVLLLHLRASARDDALDVDAIGTIEQLVGVLEQESRQLHASYLRGRPSLATLADTVRDVIVPRVRPAHAVIADTHRSSDAH